MRLVVGCHLLLTRDGHVRLWAEDEIEHTTEPRPEENQATSACCLAQRARWSRHGGLGSPWSGPLCPGTPSENREREGESATVSSRGKAARPKEKGVVSHLPANSASALVLCLWNDMDEEARHIWPCHSCRVQFSHTRCLQSTDMHCLPHAIVALVALAA